MCLVCLGHTELCFVKCGFPFWDWTLFFSVISCDTPVGFHLPFCFVYTPWGCLVLTLLLLAHSSVQRICCVHFPHLSLWNHACFFCNALISLLSFSTFSRAFSCFSFFLGCTLRCVKIISLHQNLGHEAFFFLSAWSHDFVS